MSDRPPPLPIPKRLNVALALVASAAALALLWVASHSAATGPRILAAVAFSYVNNTLVALLHESVHGVFHSSRRLNDLFGRWLAAFFPTSFTLQRFFHLGHHRRNRSAAERFDYVGDGESLLLKRLQWYGILTGLYWLLPPLSCLAFFLRPRAFSTPMLQGDAAWSRQTGADAMAAGVDRLPAGVVRSEILLSGLWQAGLFWCLGLSPSGWLLCYAAFAVNWSSLQYADHAWSPLDTIQGAWNLRVNPLVGWLFLNYHHHRAHHENPNVPWLYLGRFVDRDAARPALWRIYLSMWRGPRPLPKTAA